MCNFGKKFGLAFVFTFLGLLACNNIVKHKPEDILIEYLKADMVGDFEQAYSYISKRDKNHKSLEKYISEK